MPEMKAEAENRTRASFYALQHVRAVIDETMQMGPSAFDKLDAEAISEAVLVYRILLDKDIRSPLDLLYILERGNEA